MKDGRRKREGNKKKTRRRDRQQMKVEEVRPGKKCSGE